MIQLLIQINNQKGGAKMKLKWRMLILFCLLLGGCSFAQPYDLTDAKQTLKQIAQDEYHMAGKSLILLEPSKYEQADELYYVANEMELAKVIQYAYDNGFTSVAYQSEKTIDIDQTAKILSVVNPFDLSLTQNDTAFTSATDQTLYVSHHVEIKNLDPRYEEALQEARKRIPLLINDGMSENEKITAIHDYIIQNTIYDIDSQDQTHQKNSLFQAAGVLIDGRGVCTGYSRAFMILAHIANIPAIYVSSEGMNHGWNYVYDGHSWRYIDVTWDDPVPDQGSGVQTNFLNLSVEEFFQEGSHTLNAGELDLVDQVVENLF